MASSNATARMYEDFPWLWAVRNGYYPGEYFRVQELRDELEIPRGSWHWLIVDLGEGATSVVPVSVRSGENALPLNKILWHAGRTPERTIRYIVQEVPDGYVILRPPPGKNFIDMASALKA